MTPTITLRQLRARGPCSSAEYGRVKRLLTKLSKLKGGCDAKFTAQDVVNSGLRLDDLIWITSIGSVKKAEVDRRLRMWKADCAALVLPAFECEYPDDDRPRKAIIATRKHARGRMTMTSKKTTSAAARAAFDARLVAASDAAKGAAWAAMNAARADGCTGEWSITWGQWIAAWVTDKRIEKKMAP